MSLCAQTVTANNPAVAASLSVMAANGDQTYCVATLNKTTPQIALTCRRSGITLLTTTIIRSTSVISAGDLMWIFAFDQANPKLVHFQVAADIRTNGMVTSNELRSSGDIAWK